MKKLALLLVAALFVPFTAAEAASEAAPRAIDKAIAAIADQYVTASLAGDAAAIAALYTEDAVEMPPHQPSIEGRAAIKAYYEKVIAGGKLTAFSLDHRDSRAGGDIGYDTGTYRQSVTPTAGGAAMEDTGKYVVLLRRVGGEWKVAHAIYNSDHPEPAAPAAGE